MKLTFNVKGDDKKTKKILDRMLKASHKIDFEKYGEQGVEALQAYTPVATGETALSWSYEVHREKDRISIAWHNSNVVGGTNVAVLIQFGHATKDGGWVEGIDYINPALAPIFENMLKELKKEVRGL